MNDKKFFLSTAAAVTILITSIIIHTTRTPEKPVENIVLTDGSELVVAIPKDMPGLFVTEDAMFGYHYDLIEAYADAAGLRLSVLPVTDSRTAMKKIGSGKADIALGVSRDLLHSHNDVPVASSSFVVVGRRNAGLTGKPACDEAVFGLLKDRKTLVSHGFKLTKTYDQMLDSLRGGNIFVTSDGCGKAAGDIVDGRYDFYVCEKSEAQLICALDRKLRQFYEFGENVEISAVFNNRIVDLKTDFSAWLSEYRRTNEFAALTYHYFDKGATSRMGGYAYGNMPGTISPFDHVMRAVGEREGTDWRLMAAIAYCESRFKPDVVSHKGAKGLMQIMPVVARQFGVPDEEVMNPEVNITLAVKLLNKIEDMMDLPADVPYIDRMSLVLASYNCGVGHVADARRLAAKYGMNPDSWDDVSHFLVKKAEPEYYSDDVVKNGKFRGSNQTLAFVESVMGRYNAYCTLAAK